MRLSTQRGNNPSIDHRLFRFRFSEAPKHQGPYGENLAQGQSTWETAITAWYDEEALYDFGNPGYSESTGHFTQLIWKSTVQLTLSLN